jgi:integrase
MQAHGHTQASLRREVGPYWKDHGLVFCQADGSWWNPPAITLAFIRAVRSAGVPAIRLHDLRRTHAGLLLAAGVTPKVVSERLGHSSVAFTLGTYAHAMPDMQSEAAELFSGLVFGSTEPDDEPNDPHSTDPDDRSEPTEPEEDEER